VTSLDYEEQNAMRVVLRSCTIIGVPILTYLVGTLWASSNRGTPFAWEKVEELPIVIGVSVLVVAVIEGALFINHRNKRTSKIREMEKQSEI